MQLAEVFVQPVCCHYWCYLPHRCQAGLGAMFVEKNILVSALSCPYNKTVSVRGELPVVDVFNLCARGDEGRGAGCGIYRWGRRGARGQVQWPEWATINGFPLCINEGGMQPEDSTCPVFSPYPLPSVSLFSLLIVRAVSFVSKSWYFLVNLLQIKFPKLCWALKPRVCVDIYILTDMAQRFCLRVLLFSFAVLFLDRRAHVYVAVVY